MAIRSEEERLPRKKLEALQLERLKALADRAYRKVPFYKKSFDRAGVKPGDIKKLKDVEKLPFTVKQDLRDNYPFGMFAVPMNKVVRIHASSGTTGKPTVAGYTRKDIAMWAELMARSFVSAGATPRSIIHNAYGYGLFTGGLGAHYGAERLGATVVPVSGGQTQRQIMLLVDFGPDVICCTPSYALNLAEVGDKLGVDWKKLPLKVGVLGAEPWSENMRSEIEKRLSIKAIDIYGLSEVMGPGVSCECVEGQSGPHVYEDHFLVEIINPQTGAALKPGEKGELVFTTLTKEAFPLIRYRTRDLSSLNQERCVCGRTAARMSRVTGRTDDMLIIRGVNVFPSQIEHVLLDVEGLEPHYQIIVDRVNNLDVMEVQIEMSEKLFSDEMKELDSLTRKIEHDIKDYLGVNAKVKLTEPRSIARSEGKAKRVIDKRKI
ncbi:MAG TPA: phenylacetate--CoA ligase [bacterium]|nr:phenylacetate--CoA ligase [bacterium]